MRKEVREEDIYAKNLRNFKSSGSNERNRSHVLRKCEGLQPAAGLLTASAAVTC
jgi:hypothetical protein